MSEKICSKTGFKCISRECWKHRNCILESSEDKAWTELMEASQKQREYIASLESQLRERDRIIAEYHSLIIPLHEWAHNNTAFKLGESITKRILEMAKSSVDKDQEIQALKEALRHFIHVYDVGDTDTDVYNLVESCRKLIGD